MEAGALLWRERRLWWPALWPLLVSLGMFAFALLGLAAYAGELHALAIRWWPEPPQAEGMSALLGSLWRALRALVGWIAFGVLAAACLLFALVLSSVLGAPFHDWLSRRVESVTTGAIFEQAGGHPLRDAARAVGEELRRLIALAAVVAPLALAGLLVPGAQLVTAPALLGVTLIFLTLDYASYALDRRGYRFADKRRWARAHAAEVIGFGAAAFAICLVPLANLAAMPLLVTGGTLLALRTARPLARGATDRAAGAGSAPAR